MSATLVSNIRIMQGSKDYNLSLCHFHTMLALLFLLLRSEVIEGAVCQKFDYIQNDAAVPESSGITPYPNNIVKVNYTCPGFSDPKHHTECCSTINSKGCCPRTRYFYEIDRTVATAIALSVTSLCIILAITIAVCCFWSRCPLYSSCRTEFSPEIATYVSKEDDINMDTMPREIHKKNNKFSPVAISNGNIPSGVDMEAI